MALILKKIIKEKPLGIKKVQRKLINTVKMSLLIVCVNLVLVQDILENGMLINKTELTTEYPHCPSEFTYNKSHQFRKKPNLII